MKISKSMFAYMGLAGCLCLVGFVTPVVGQQAPARGQGIIGTLDPKTGTFKPLIKPGMIEDLESPSVAAVTYTGEFKVTFTITVKSTSLSSDVIACDVTATAIDAELTTPKIIEEDASVAATPSSGTTRTCVVTIPYSWVLLTPTTDMVTLEWVISAPGVYTSSTNELPNRFSSQTIGTMLVPANGKTTSIAVSATI